MEYEVRSSNYPNFLMATGYYGEQGKAKAQRLIDEGYFNKHLMPEFKDAIFIVVQKKNNK
jgi:hypothetical protein